MGWGYIHRWTLQLLDQLGPEGQVGENCKGQLTTDNSFSLEQATKLPFLEALMIIPFRFSPLVVISVTSKLLLIIRNYQKSLNMKKKMGENKMFSQKSMAEMFILNSAM